MSEFTKSPVLGCMPRKSDSEMSDLECEQLDGSIAPLICSNDNIPAESHHVTMSDQVAGLSQVAEKRQRRESDEIIEDEPFITINRRRKQLRRSLSVLENEANVNKVNESVQKRYEVCISSIEVLPRQIALAKLLRSNDISGILKIKFKSPHKALILFNCKDDAKKLINCQKIQDHGYKCYMTFETQFCYGVVKGIDLDLDLKEVQESLTCETEIISIRRLKRQSEDHKWVDSEAVRVCFKSNALPKYIYGFGCQFEVYNYNYPVAQCSGCWRFGHLKKYCPTKKIICPKCGSKHPNCMTTEFHCINCKGRHMAFDKFCPIFIKEKKIREIMSKDVCTYKKALGIYEEKKKSEEAENDTDSMASLPLSEFPTLRHNEKSYNNIVVTDAIVHHDIGNTKMNHGSMESGNESEVEINYNKTQSHKRNNRKNRRKKNIDNNFSEILVGNKEGINLEKSSEVKKDTQKQRREGIGNRSWFFKMWIKIKEIIMLDNKCEEKLKIFINYVISEIKIHLINYASEEGLVGNILSLIFNG